MMNAILQSSWSCKDSRILSMAAAIAVIGRHVRWTWKQHFGSRLCISTDCTYLLPGLQNLYSCCWLISMWGKGDAREWNVKMLQQGRPWSSVMELAFKVCSTLCKRPPHNGGSFKVLNSSLIHKYLFIVLNISIVYITYILSHGQCLALHTDP